MAATRAAALVTGASGGIGREIARRLAADGSFVIAHHGRDAERGAETVRLIAESGGAGVALAADLTRIEAIDALFRDVDEVLLERGFAGLDVLVNNAGLGGGGSIDAVDEEAFDRLFNLNAKGTFFVTQRAIPRLRDGGHIINVSSMVSRAAYPGSIAYAMSKAAVNSMTVSLAAGLGRRRISVNAIAPGATETPFIAGVTADPALVERIVAGTALGRLGQPDDIAGVVAFLASAEGSWITGQVIEVSGGMHL